jgi:hypothetical protein
MHLSSAGGHAARRSTCTSATAPRTSRGEVQSAHLAQAADWAREAASEQEYTLRRQAVDRMARSFWQSWTSLFLQRRAHHDTLHITPDPLDPDTLSLEWHYDSGYHGGLLYHPAHRDGQPQPFGNWSIHT